MKIEKYLIDKGLNPALMGFDYLVESVKLERADKTYKANITKKLYPEIAEKYDTTASKVERAMRHCLNSAGHYVSVSQFIATAEIETR